MDYIENLAGLPNCDWLAEEVGMTVLERQYAIELVFDPLGILNPGKAN